MTSYVRILELSRLRVRLGTDLLPSSWSTLLDEVEYAAIFLVNI